MKSNKSASIETERSNMKKILLIGLCCLCLCGCSNIKYEISQMNWSEKINLNWVTGTIKNNSSKSCNTLWINLEYKSGSLKEEDLCIVNNLEAKETKNFECLYSGNITNIENYSIDLKSIECVD